MLLRAAAEDDADLQPVHAALSFSNMTQLMTEVSTVSQSVICVVGGVWGDDDVRKFLQSQQQLVSDRGASPIGVEDPVFALNDVQRRAGQRAAFQSRHKSLSVQQ